jgi:ribosome biogenesis protein ERB1
MSDSESVEDFPDIASDYEEYEEKRFKVYRKQQLPNIEPEYDSDSSEEEYHNTVGNIPMEWYNDFPHIGYDIDGKKIMKPAQGDDLDRFLKSMDDKDAWKSVYDKLEGKDVVLSKEELKMLKRIQQHQFPDSQFDPYEPTIEWFSRDTSIMPLSAAPEPKRRFIPSKMEGSKIMKIAKAIRAGLIVPGQKRSKSDDKPVVYDIWNNEEINQGRPNRIQAPKMALPQHSESYNPPAEYLFTREEEKEWLDLDPEDRAINYMPKKYDSLRKVGAYPQFIKERFERCLDLYLCPRTVKQKLDIDPESLIPKLPNPSELKPFPTKLSITYSGHSERIRSFCIDPSGQWIASGSDDFTVRIWEVSSGRNVNTITLEDQIMFISWNPNKTLSILGVCCGDKVYLLNPGVGTDDQIENTTGIIQDTISQLDNDGAWGKPTPLEKKHGHLIHLQLKKTSTNLVWHRKGDYFATVAPDGK